MKRKSLAEVSKWFGGIIGVALVLHMMLTGDTVSGILGVAILITTLVKPTDDDAVKVRNPLASNIEGVYDLIMKSFSPDQMEKFVEKIYKWDDRAEVISDGRSLYVKHKDLEDILYKLNKTEEVLDAKEKEEKTK